MILEGLDEALEEAVRKPPRRRRTRIGFRQAAAQLLFVVAVAAFVVALLCYGNS